MARSLVLLLLCGCAQTLGPPPSFAPAAQPSLRAIPSAHGLGVGERRAVVAVLEEGSERIASIPLAKATVEHPEVAVLEGDTLVGVAAGSTTLHLEHATHTLDVPIVVTAAEPVALSLNPIVAPRLGERIPVQAVVRYEDGTEGDATLDADWSTATSARLFVPNTPDTRGAVVAIQPKPSTLVARFAGLEARTEIVPEAGEPSGIHVRLAWAHGEFRRFGAFAHWTDGQTREVSAGCLWRFPGAEPFRGLEHPQPGPWIPVSTVSWDRVATCELAATKASGSLFAH